MTTPLVPWYGAPIMHTSVVDIFQNPCSWAGFCAWFLAQATKLICGLCRTGRLDVQYLVRLGGMPSAHSALVSGVATAIGLTVGFGHPLFALAGGFACIVMYDAATLRRAAGSQARLLNDIVHEIFQERRLSEQKLAELLGHTGLEVFMGMLMGILVGLLTTSLAVVY